MNILSILLVLIAGFFLASILAVYLYGRYSRQSMGPESHALPIKDHQTDIDKMLHAFAQQHDGLGYERDGLSLISANLDAFAARALAARMAGRSLDLMYYIWDDDITGRFMLAEVLKAADRGVRVRLLLDDINAQGRDPALFALDQHKNIEVRLFNPARARRNGLRRGLEMMLRAMTVTRRMHNKAFIADGRIAFVGGRNIADAYFNASETTNFRDLDLMLAGPSVSDCGKIFDSFWNAQSALPIRKLVLKSKGATLMAWRQKLEAHIHSPQARRYYDYIHQHIGLHHMLDPHLRLFAPQSISVISDPPEKALNRQRKNWLMDSMAPILFNARDSLDLTSPYFVPGRAGAQWLKKLAKQGCKVRVLTNSLSATDVAAVHGGYAPCRKDLLRHNVELYELKSEGGVQPLRLYGSGQASLHTKAFVVDQHTAFVGSFNFDPRSLSLNTEMGILFVCPSLTQHMEILFAEEVTGEMSYQVHLNKRNQLEWHAIEQRKPVVYYKEPHTTWPRRMVARIIQILPIHSQL